MPIEVVEISENATLSPLNAEKTEWESHREFWVDGLENQDFLNLSAAIDAVGIVQGDLIDDVDPRFASSPVQSVLAQIDETQERAIVSVDYGPDDDDGNGGDGSDTEPNDEYTVNVSSTTETVQVTRDNTGAPLRVTDGESEPQVYPATSENVLPVVELTNVREITLADAVRLNLDFAGKVNVSAYDIVPNSTAVDGLGGISMVGPLNAPPRTLCCFPIQIEEIEYNRRYRVTVRIAVNPDTFDRTIAFLRDNGTVVPGTEQDFRVIEEVSFAGLL